MGLLQSIKSLTSVSWIKKVSLPAWLSSTWDTGYLLTFKSKLLRLQLTPLAPLVLRPSDLNGHQLETVAYFIFLGFKITEDSDCSHEIKRQLLLEREAMTNLHSILKSRDNTLSTKVWIVKAMVFPIVMYGCKHRTIKKAEHKRTDAFEP